MEEKKTKESILSELVDLDGLWNTFKLVPKDPGVLMKEEPPVYDIQSPTRFLFTTVGLFVIVITILDMDYITVITERVHQNMGIQEKTVEDPEFGELMNKINNLTTRFWSLMIEFYPVLIAVVYVPIISFFNKLFFKREKVDYKFFTRLNSYLYGFITPVSTLVTAVNFYAFDLNLQIITCWTVIYLAFCAWTTTRVIDGKRLWLWFKASISIILGMALVMILFLIIGFLIGVIGFIIYY